MKKKFDYSKTYYKVTSADEIHHGYHYKDGLNILKEKFNDNPKASCVPGGFYFTNYENLPKFFEYGIWIREVTIPKGAKVVKDPNGNKWRTNKIIFGKKYHIHNDFDKWFDSEKFDWSNSHYLAEFFSKDFDKWFDPEKYNWKDSHFLATYCSQHFDKWFDPEKYNWKYSYYLAIFCSKHFDKWFDPEKFNWNYSEYLAEYCSEHFDKWFDPEKYDWYYIKYLALYCLEHKNKWEIYLPEDY